MAVVRITRVWFSHSTDVANAVKCTTITINGFTVPAKESLALYLATGTTVTMSVSLPSSTPEALNDFYFRW
jgi:hypothetical protein